MNARIKQLTDGSVLCMSENSDEAWAVLNGFSADIYEVEQGADEKYYLAGQVPQASLEELQLLAKSRAEDIKTQALTATCALEVEGVGEVIYDQQAVINVSSLLLLASDEEQSYILADDSSSMLTPTQLLDIAMAFKAHVEGIYATKLAQFAAIDAATDESELNAIFTS